MEEVIFSSDIWKMAEQVTYVFIITHLHVYVTCHWRLLLYMCMYSISDEHRNKPIGHKLPFHLTQ